MVDVAAARAAIGRINDILVRRYHYPHPIFEHVAAALDHLKEDPAAESKAALEVAAGDSGPGLTTTGAEPPTTPTEAPSEEASEIEAPEPRRTRRGRQPE